MSSFVDIQMNHFNCCYYNLLTGVIYKFLVVQTKNMFEYNK